MCYGDLMRPKLTSTDPARTLARHAQTAYSPGGSATAPVASGAVPALEQDADLAARPRTQTLDEHEYPAELGQRAKAIPCKE